MEQTKDWKLYEAGKKYNNALQPNYYDTVNTNIAFHSGDQWRNVEVHDLPKPVFNIIKRVVAFFVASLTSSKTSVHFEPLAYSNTDQDQLNVYASEVATAEVENLFEKFKFEHRIRDALSNASVEGDVAAHFYFDKNKKPYRGSLEKYGVTLAADIKGEIIMELVDGCNIMFGNANNPDVESQPYIIVIGRDMVENLKEEAKQYSRPQSDIEGIQEDRNYVEQAGDSGKIEVEADKYGKALYLIVYRRDKETGTIKVSKSVENAYIYQDIDTGLDFYPVAWLPWEKQKNQYHGRALCTGILPNQIFINRMFAMVMYHLMLSAFPKPIYDSDKIDLWTNEIGAAIQVNNLNPGDNIKSVAGYLDAGNMSNQIVQVIELAMQYTKEMLGVSDASLGAIDPKNTSAIIAVQKSTVVPLKNVQGNLFEWVEDISKILLDMMGTYYGLRPIIIERDEAKQIEMFDFATLKGMWFNSKIDVGESAYWSEIASVQTLDNLLREGKMEFVDYLERIPDQYVPQKAELIAKVREKMQLQEQMAQMQAAGQVPGALNMPQEMGGGMNG